MALAALGLKSAALNGELIAGSGTQKDFNLLQATLSGEQQGVLSYVLFDLVQLDGAAAFELAGEQDFEGIISKRADKAYHADCGEGWRKTKHVQSDEFAVVGTLPAKGARKGFGALLLARPSGAGGWVYAGRVGSGFTDRQL